MKPAKSGLSLFVRTLGALGWEKLRCPVECGIQTPEVTTMQYLVHMRLAAAARPTTAEEGRTLAEQFILPTLARCEELAAQKKILAGGPVSGTIAIVLIVEVEAVPELDRLLTSLPAWPQMETKVTPLTTFDGRRQSLLSRLEGLKTQAHK
jgi:muconolactone delta-isomerase